MRRENQDQLQEKDHQASDWLEQNCFLQSQQNLTTSFNNYNTQLGIQYQDSIYLQVSSQATMDCDLDQQMLRKVKSLLLRTRDLIISLDIKEKLEHWYMLKSAPKLLKELNMKISQTSSIMKTQYQLIKQIGQCDQQYEKIQDTDLKELCQKLFQFPYKIGVGLAQREATISQYSYKLQKLKQWQPSMMSHFELGHNVQKSKQGSRRGFSLNKRTIMNRYSSFKNLFLKASLGQKLKEYAKQRTLFMKKICRSKNRQIEA